MNRFTERFGDRIKTFFKANAEEQKQVLTDIFQFANAAPQTFKQELKEVQFDQELAPLPVVLEALARDTDFWGSFYVETLDAIFKRAKQTDKPRVILGNLLEFAYIEKENKAFVQGIVDRLCKEMDSDHLPSRLAAIWALPPYLKNPSIKNRPAITAALRQGLQDKNRKVRYVSFKALGYEDLLPPDYQLSIGDRFKTLVFGAPSAI